MNSRAFVAEFIGTFALIYVGVMVIAHLGPASENLGLVGIALAHGLVIACFVSATAAISGGHLNPAVSFGFLLARKISGATFAFYVVAQCAGGVLAALLAQQSLPGQALSHVVNGTPALGHGILPGQGLLVEAITTFFFVFVIFGTAVDRRAPRMSGLFIGLTITLGILAAGPISGGSMNPARWLGPALVGGHLENSVVYLLGPLLGAAFAALLYTNVLEDKTLLPPTATQRVDGDA